MTTMELKKYIYENNKVEYILNDIGCTHIYYHSNKEFWSCCNYNGDNPSAVNVFNNEYLKYFIFHYKTVSSACEMLMMKSPILSSSEITSI